MLEMARGIATSENIIKGSTKNVVGCFGIKRPTFPPGSLLDCRVRSDISGCGRMRNLGR